MYFSSEGNIPVGFLASFDPRIKFVVMTVMLIAVFSAAQIWRLTLLTAVACGAVFFLRVAWLRVARRLYSLRWILFAGVLLHLFSGSGRTLMGVSFLSSDGLIDGCLVAWRLALAVFFASLFCWSTPVPELVAALLAVLQPLRRVLPVSRIGRHVLIMLMWLPLVQDQIFALQHPWVGATRTIPRQKNGVGMEVSGMIDRLLVAAEGLVDAILAGDHPRLNVLPSLAARVSLPEVGMLLVALIFLPFWFWGLP